VTIHHLDDVRQGFEDTCDVVVVGSGAGGAVAAANLAAAGLDVILLEAGPQLKGADMTRDGPKFMSRYYWEGGMRMILGNNQIPAMAGRCLGGSTVVNSAIMLKLPDWVRKTWVAEDGLTWLEDAALDRSFERVFDRLKVAPTPMSVMGKRNLLTRDILTNAGLDNGPLPRAVHGCAGCCDCITGCASRAKQSVDLNFVPSAIRDGARVYTCAAVDRVLTEGVRAVGVTGTVIDPIGRRPLAKFTIRAKKVVLSAGVMATPVILLRSGIHGGRRVGKTLFMHLSCGAVAVMDEPVEPWIGATQGWGAISPDIQGLKYESLWAPPSLIMVKWGDLGERWLRQIQDARNICLIALVYRGQCKGRVRARRDGTPLPTLWVPRHEIHTLMRGLKVVVDSMLDMGVRFVNTGVVGCPNEIRTPADAETLLSPRIKAGDVDMTGNHVFGSCRMSADPKRGPVDLEGRVRGVEGLYVMDGSICPNGTAVNPQATIMAMSDVLSRRLGELTV
jgi:choline dehydrogenase-like flavoprotein